MKHYGTISSRFISAARLSQIYNQRLSDGGVLVDAATRYSAGRILRQLRGHEVTAHALTHVHPNHQGASQAICEALGIGLWCGAGDVMAMETGQMGQKQIPDNWVTRFLNLIWSGPPYPVARALQEGDEVGGFTVIETPGHTPGHLAFWRESDRTLLLGDVLRNSDLLTNKTGLQQAPDIFTPSPARNRASARKLAALRPNLVCFGHGPPLRDGQKFVEFVAEPAQ